MNSPYRSIYSGKSNSTSSGLWNPFDAMMTSQEVTDVTFIVFLEGTKLKVQPGIQYSHDGVEWGLPQAIDESEASYWITAQGRTVLGKASSDGFFKAPADFLADGSSPPPTEQLFVRFGLFVINSGADGKANGGRASLGVRFRPVIAGSMTLGPLGTATGGGATALFTPMSEAVATASISYLRMSWEMVSNTNDVETVPGYQLSDDGVNWGTATTTGLTKRDSNGITYGTTFADVTAIQASRYVRFGMFANNKGAGSDIEACVSSLRVDWRA